MGHEQRREGLEALVIVGAEAHAHALCAGIHGQLQVMRGVADHQVRAGSTPNWAINSSSIFGCGLDGGLVGRARGVEQRAQPRLRQRMVQALPALAGGHGQEVVARLQRLQHVQRAGNSTRSSWRAR
jgi:hypothetical protein